MSQSELPSSPSRGTDRLIDRYHRAITYLRVSVTDRCDLRCLYCMAEDMTFLPRRDLLSLEELQNLCGIFVDLGVRKLRITGKGAFTDVYEVMAKWGANHGAFSYGHIGADLIALASILRIPVYMHNVDSENIFRPSAWNAFCTADLEGADGVSPGHFAEALQCRRLDCDLAASAPRAAA